MSFQIPTPEQLLQIGYNCGLNLVEEAYASMMHHYDAFFLIADLNNQIAEFNQSLVAVGFGNLGASGIMKFNGITILTAAEKINYTLMELPEELPITSNDGDENEVSLEEILDHDEFLYDPFEDIKFRNEEEQES